MGRIRKLSESGIYHVYCRGNSRRVIFYDDVDRLLFCNCVNIAAEKHKTKIFAYALMDNHFHLLVKTDYLSKFVASLKISFIKKYNKKHYFTDSLCGSRFGSAVKESSAALKKSLLYILCNPVKAGICNDVENYRWTSFDNKHSDIKVDNSLLTLFFESRNDLKNQVNSAQKIGDHEIVEKDDNWYKTSFYELAELLVIGLNGRKLSLLTKNEQIELKNYLLEKSTATYFQIASLLNVSYKFVLNKSPRRQL